MRPRPLQNREGMALIMTTLVVALLTIVVFDFFYESWVRAAIAGGYRDETKALFAARSGQEAAKLILMEDARANIPRDALDEQWAGAIPLPIEDEYAFLSITDESGKVNVNKLVTDKGYPDDRWIAIFTRLLTRLELDPNLAGALLDWIDPNSEPSTGGAEESHYRSLDNPRGVKNARLDSIDELLLVKGFTPKILGKLREHVTLWSGPALNINTATPMALAALDDEMTPAIVKAIIRHRTLKPFTRREDIKLVPGMEEIYPRIALAIDTKSDYYAVESTATFRETAKTIRAVYRRSANQTETFYYRVF